MVSSPRTQSCSSEHLLSTIPYSFQSMQKFANTAELVQSMRPEKPVNCLSLPVLADHVARFKAGFPGTVAYAVKANPEEALLRALLQNNISTFDVASVAEIARLRGLNDKALLLYDNPVKSRLEIEESYGNYAVRNFAVDDLLEVEKIAEVVGNDSNVQISVRFNIAGSTAIYDLGKKFGASKEFAVRILQRARDLGFRLALTFHPGSQCTEATAYNEFIACAAGIEQSADLEIEMLNIGGGFPTVYINSGAPVLNAFFAEIGQQFEDHFGGRDIDLVCEPGRALVDPAISILTRVKHRRVEPVVFLNDGIYGGFMEQLLSKVELPTRCYRNGKPLSGELEPFKVFGPTCDSLDVFSYEVPLPGNIQEGDWIEFAEMGGYGSATATTFNGYGTGEYIYVDEGFPRSASGTPT